MFSTFFIISALLFILGTVIGSFLNVVIYRSMKGEQWVKGRSHCENCHKNIIWFDNIPLFSYFFLAGKCRWCKAPISISHPVVEFLAGTLFVWWYWSGSFFFRLTQQPFHYIQPLFWLGVGLLLLIIFFTDLYYMIIPDEAVLALTFLTLIYRVALTISGLMQPADFIRTLMVALVASGFFLILWGVTAGKGMGLGDAKLAFPFGLLLGWPNALVGLMIAFIVGGLVGVVLVFSRRKKMKEAVPFGPFFIVGTVVALIWGNSLATWYIHLLR